MKNTYLRRLLAMLLSLCLLLALAPVTMETEAEAVSGVNSLTCADFISNSIARKYIDTMMRYYINNNSSLQTTLNNGLSVVFMFEGGSDNYWNGSTYYDGMGDVRNQAVCIVVQKDSNGNAYIPYYCENCSSVPDDPQNCTNGVAYSGATTVLDGIHSFYTWNHTGPYGAFQLNVGKGYYVPSANPNGYTAGASGLNIHTRSTNTCGGAAAGWDWSLGCQVIGSGYYTGNEFNQFMKVVAGISYNVWINYSSKTFNTIGTGTTKGYYVLDRQLAKMNPDGTQFGAGSLIELYTSTALNNITAASTTARNNAGFSLDYIDQCDRYASHCTLEVTYEGCEVRGLPCSAGTDEGSTLIETLKVGDTLTAVGIYKNTYGNYWYEVISSAGELGYVYGGNVEYKGDIISDITLTGATYPNGHVETDAFYVNGTIAAEHNELTEVACYIYSGFGIGETAAIGASDTPTSNSYDLLYSTVDDKTWMSNIGVGNYTYCLFASYKNYYATDATTLQSNTGTLTLMEEYFAVIPSAVDQSSCKHTNTTHKIEVATCTENGTSITVCSTCGLLEKSQIIGAHNYGSWTTVQPTCTEKGSMSRTCSACGNVETQTIPAKGHDYSVVTQPATCQSYERFDYTCGTCGHYYSAYANELMSQWLETKPAGIDESKIETKTQYRYKDYKTTTSKETSMEGATQLSKEWVQKGSGTVKYVKNWHEGFETSHALYGTYHKTPKTASETATQKTVVTGETIVGYVYWHWCYGTYTGGPVNRTTSITNDGTHSTFHAFFGTTDPSTLTTASDTSVTLPNAACCTDSHWYYNVPVYEQSYTEYEAEFTYGYWTEFSEWSDTPVTATDTRTVETRTLYRYNDAQLGDHNYVGGACSVCGEADPTVYYLFGYINGRNYACEEDYVNMGEYKIQGGTLTVTFERDSYVAVKSADNNRWYMTQGWLGYDATSATLYSTAGAFTNADKLFVPGGVEVTFTLKVNEDDTMYLSYVAEEKEYVKPTITPKYPSLSFEGEIFYNITFAASDVENAVEWGLITFESNVADGTVDNADYVIPGHTYDAASGYYKVRSNGIAAKKLGDTLYFRVYAKLTDGTYAYSGTYNYSAMAYAKDRLANSTNEELKRLCVAMVNYGAAAQNHFAHNTGNLANSFLTTTQAALVQSYSSDLLAAVGSVDTSKNGTLSAFSGYSSRYPSVSFEGAFGISYYFTPSNAMDNGLSLYYWTAADYAAASTLSPNNASGKLTMEATGAGSYKTTVSGIAAKDIDSTIYVVGIYFSGGTMHCTGVLPYSLGAYCVDRAANSTGTMQALAKATAVYGYYARQYFTE